MRSAPNSGAGRFVAAAAVLAAVLAINRGAGAEEIRLVVQSSPLAGSQYYGLGAHRQEMRVGDTLTLVREPENRRDANAIRVEWRGHMLGYVPRRENRVLAAALDRGEPLRARIARLRESSDPWQRVEFEVFVVL